MLAQTIRRRILLTGGSGLLSTMGPVGLGVARAADTVPVLLAGGVTLCSADLSWLIWLSNCKPPSQRNLQYGPGMNSSYFTFQCLHVDSETESELYNSPQCRDYSLRTAANY